MQNPLPQNSSRGLQPYYAGLADLASGDALRALLALERAVKLEPRFAPAHAGLSAALTVLGYETKAAEEAKTAVDLLNGLPHEDALWVRGQFYETRNDWQNAARAFETLSSMAPESVMYGLRYVQALTKLGRSKDAYAVVEKLQHNEPASADNPAIYLAEAQVAESADDYKRELEAATRAELVARSRGMNFVVGRAELSESWALDNLAKLPEAERKAADAQILFANLKDLGGEGKAWKNLADVYIDQQNLDKAKAAYEKAIARFHQIGWRTGEAVGLNNLAYVFRDSGDLPRAGDLFEQSLRISRSMGDLRRQAMALTGVAIILKRQGNLGGAEEANGAALELHKQLSEDASCATVLNDLAIVLEDEGKVGEAEQRLEEALAIFQKLGRQMDVAMVYGNLGDLKLRVGDLATAEKNYKVQVTLGRKIPQPKQLGYGLFGLGQVALLRHNLAAATKLLGDSLLQRKHIGDLGGAAESQLALSEVAVQQKRFIEAETKARNSLDEFVKERQEDQRAVALAMVSEALVGQGKMPEAMAAADEAIKLANISEDVDSRINVWLHIWKALEASGRGAEAVRLVGLALHDAEICKFLPQMLEARAALALMRLDSGDRSAEGELAQIRAEATGKGLLLVARRIAVPKTPLAVTPLTNPIGH